MPSSALALVLLAALSHALWNFAAKTVASKNGDGIVFVWLYALLGVVLLIPLSIAWLWANDEHVRWTWVAAGAVSGVAHLAYSVVLQHGYRIGDMNVVYPLARGTGPLLTIVVALTVLHEKVSASAVAGAVVVCLGIAVVAGLKLNGPGSIWGVGTGVAIAAYTLWDSHAVTVIGAPVIVYFMLGQFVEVLLITPAAVRRRRAIRSLITEHWRACLTVAVLSPLGYLLILQAMTMAPVALVAPAREVSIVFGGLLSWFVLKEGQSLRRLAGSAVVLVGIGLIAL